jgi:hypothetical protein
VNGKGRTEEKKRSQKAKLKDEKTANKHKASCLWPRNIILQGTIGTCK